MSRNVAWTGSWFACRSSNTATPTGRHWSSTLSAAIRIPDGAPTWEINNDKSKVDDQTLIVGQELVGPKGFSCIACHQVGDYVPQKVALGTRGSDLFGLGKRMRHSYFVRWTRSPLRIVPGVEIAVLQPERSTESSATTSMLNWRRSGERWPTRVSNHQPTRRPSNSTLWSRKTRRRESSGTSLQIRNRMAAAMFLAPLPSASTTAHNALFDLDNLTLRRLDLRRFRPAAHGRQELVLGTWPALTSSLGLTAVRTTPSLGQTLRTLWQNEEAISPKKDNGTVGQLLDYRPDGQGVKLKFALNFRDQGNGQSGCR